MEISSIPPRDHKGTTHLKIEKAKRRPQQSNRNRIVPISQPLKACETSTPRIALKCHRGKPAHNLRNGSPIGTRTRPFSLSIYKARRALLF